MSGPTYYDEHARSDGVPRCKRLPDVFLTRNQLEHYAKIAGSNPKADELIAEMLMQLIDKEVPPRRA